MSLTLQGVVLEAAIVTGGAALALRGLGWV
jgi:hypothetical protein